MAEGQVFTLTVTAGVAGSFFLKGGTNSHFLSTCSSGAWGSRAVIWGLWRNPTPPLRSQVNVNGDRPKNLSSTSMPPSPGLMTVLPKKSSPSHPHPHPPSPHLPGQWSANWRRIRWECVNVR
ncbi:unnamed protein product [Rangifer tarandus platyrhynchus]|uniref:Uncharacterized protein n=2 Tax=Rangifer tarandus platyrhynchus TaxID=3082113 RepID=A0AC59YG91_RANTA|nr:unnamed protein product [Rangifer tarandus platyrhynchus]